MPFQDYSAVPAQNTQIGDDIFIGPNMERAKVRPSLQQIAADGRNLYDLFLSAGVGQLPVFTAAGTGSVQRPGNDKQRALVSNRDFTTGLVQALTAVRNTDDAAFSGSVYLEPGIVDLASSAVLPVSYSRIFGFQLSSTYRTTSGIDVFAASGASFVNSIFRDFRTYGGRDVFAATTGGEIASLDFRGLAFSQFNRDAFSFAGGLTSSTFSHIKADSSLGRYGIYSGGGSNNDNLIEDCDFTNLTGPAVKFLNTAAGLTIRDCRVEGNGQAATAVFELVAASGVRIQGGWYEGYHEYFLKLTGASDGGVVIDGITDIGAKNGGGFKAGLFDVGSNMVIFGTNGRANRTVAPLNCLVYGYDPNLYASASNLWERKTQRGGKVHLKARNRAVDGATFDLLSFSRTTASPNDFTNLQMITGTLVVSFAGPDTGAVTRSISRSFPVQIIALGGGTMTVAVGSAYGIVENAGTITITPQAKSGATTTAATLEIVFANVHASLGSLINVSFEYDNNTNLASNQIAVTPA